MRPSIKRDTPRLDSPPSSPPPTQEPLLKLPQQPQSPPPYQSLKYDHHNNNDQSSLPEEVFDETSPIKESKNIPPLIMSPSRDHHHLSLTTPLDESYLKLWISKLIETKPPKEEDMDTKYYNVSDHSAPITPPAPCSSPTTQTMTNCIDFENVMNIHQMHFDLNRSDDEGFMAVSPSENDIINNHLGNFYNIEAPCHFPGSPSTAMMGAGLVNLGNMCFMNAILQCFTHTVPLVLGLRSCSHATPCACEDYTDDYARSCVICVLRQHIETCIAFSGGVVCPVGLVDNLENFSSSFRGYKQSDAHEFMLSLLNKLQRCFLEGEENVIEKVFGGLLLSKLQCCSCGHSSNSYEPMIDMSLEIEDVNTIQHALNSFTMVEKMDEKFTCDGCLKQVSKEKQLMLNKAPVVLVFHLKRFKKAGDYVKKIEDHVYFTLDLDLEPYTIRNPNDTETLKYDLYALVVHVGSNPNSGHYYCFIRSAPEKWHKFDDDQATSVSGDYVLGQQAYILFYVQQGIPWFSSSIIKSDEKPKEPKPSFDDGVMDEKKPNSDDRNYDDDPIDIYKENADIYAYEEKKKAM